MTRLSRVPSRIWINLATLALATLLARAALAHNVTGGDAGYVLEVSGFLHIPFMYLGAKHMVTGYDHILFLFGVIFFLYRTKDIGLYVSLFALGHSVTMLAGVWFGIQINSYIIDATIGFSVVCKALDWLKNGGAAAPPPHQVAWRANPLRGEPHARRHRPRCVCQL